MLGQLRFDVLHVCVFATYIHHLANPIIAMACLLGIDDMIFLPQLLGSIKIGREPLLDTEALCVIHERHPSGLERD